MLSLVYVYCLYPVLVCQRNLRQFLCMVLVERFPNQRANWVPYSSLTEVSLKVFCTPTDRILWFASIAVMRHRCLIYDDMYVCCFHVGNKLLPFLEDRRMS